MNKNKSLVEKRTDNLKDLEEATQLLDETAVKTDETAKTLESHFKKWYLKWLIPIGVVGAIVVVYLGFGTDWSSSGSDLEMQAQAISQLNYEFSLVQ